MKRVISVPAAVAFFVPEIVFVAVVNTEFTGDVMDGTPSVPAIFEPPFPEVTQMNRGSELHPVTVIQSLLLQSYLVRHFKRA